MLEKVDVEIDLVERRRCHDEVGGIFRLKKLVSVVTCCGIRISGGKSTSISSLAGVVKEKVVRLGRNVEKRQSMGESRKEKKEKRQSTKMSNQGGSNSLLGAVLKKKW